MNDSGNGTMMETPHGDAAGFKKHFRNDLLSGFLVFLIALPLCLGISLACGYPAIAGIFTAIIGAIATTFVSNSELTIKGPAAGLIVIALGAIEDFGGDGTMGGFTDADMTAYRCALAIGVAAATIQIVLALCRCGILGEFFPLSAVHGMLAAIGVIIIAKQFPVALGVEAKGGPLLLLEEFPEFIRDLNPEIALIGCTSIVIMFAWPYLKQLNRFLKIVPAPLVVLVVTVPLGLYFHLLQEHSYTVAGVKYSLGQKYLVAMPNRIFGMFDDLTFPDFIALTNPKAWKWVAMFAIIGSLESVLSAKAVDLIDPWKRKTNLNHDLLAVGIGNLLCSFVGGLPMISEIVRSRANIDNGARTRFADYWHGVFLLVCVALIPVFLHLIPLAALAGMLVYTGFRLAHPLEFLHIYKVGKEQLAVFVVTIVGVLATDLLVGILIGIGLELLIDLVHGVPIRSIFSTKSTVEKLSEKTVVIRVQDAAIFTNWLFLRHKVVHAGLQDKQNVVLDFAHTKFVDHSVMSKLLEIQTDMRTEGLSLSLTGLEGHKSFSDDPGAARKQINIGASRV